MEDQVHYLTSIGVSAVSNISSQAEIDRSRIENGEFSIVFGSPEAWLMKNKRDFIITPYIPTDTLAK